MQRARDMVHRLRALPRSVVPWVPMAVAACLLALVPVPWASAEGEPASGGGLLPLEEIVANIRLAAAEPQGRYGFRQDVVLHWLLAKWYFHSEVVRTEDGYDLETFNAPAIVPKEISGALIDVSHHLDRFLLSVERVEVLEDGVKQYVISGDRRPEFTTGAEGGRIWVRGDTWLIERVEIRYPWGRLDIRQDHQQVAGYTFPRRQEVRVSPLGASMIVEYKDFWFAG